MKYNVIQWHCIKVLLKLSWTSKAGQGNADLVANVLKESFGCLSIPCKQRFFLGLLLLTATGEEGWWRNQREGDCYDATTMCLVKSTNDDAMKDKDRHNGTWGQKAKRSESQRQLISWEWSLNSHRINSRRSRDRAKARDEHESKAECLDCHIAFKQLKTLKLCI